MTNGSNTRAPFTVLSLPQGRALSICALALYFLAFNLGGLFYQLKGVDPEYYLLSAVSTFCGMLGGGLFMDTVERRCSGPRGKAWRFGFLAVLLLPVAFCLISFFLMDFSDNLLLTAFRPGIWALPLAPVLRLFFRYEPSPAGRAVWLGIALGVGHLCWALVLPLGRFLMRPGAVEDSTLLFLNVTRCLLAFVVGYLAWKAHDSLTEKEEKARQNPQAVSEPLHLRKAAILLLAFLPCFLLTGTLGFVLFSRPTTHGTSPELIQIAMAFCFPLAGLWLAGGAERLRPLLSAFILCFVLAPVLLPESAPLPSWLRQAAFFLCLVSLRGLSFGGTLYMAALGPHLSRPSLALISVWLIHVTALAAPGLSALFKDFPFFNQWFCFALTLACVGSFLLLRCVFPLPENPISPAEDNAVTFMRVEAAKQHAFAAAFQLSKRETEVLDGILRGVERKDISVELGVRDSTVKFHIRGVLQKTSMPNRQRLLHYYTGWQTE